MYKIFKALIVMLWVGDVCNLPILEFLDKEIPINFWAWFLILLFILSSDNTPWGSIKMNKE